MIKLGAAILFLASASLGQSQLLTNISGTSEAYCGDDVFRKVSYLYDFSQTSNTGINTGSNAASPQWDASYYSGIGDSASQANAISSSISSAVINAQEFESATLSANSPQGGTSDSVLAQAYCNDNFTFTVTAPVMMYLGGYESGSIEANYDVSTSGFNTYCQPDITLSTANYSKILYENYSGNFIGIQSFGAAILLTSGTYQLGSSDRSLIMSSGSSIANQSAEASSSLVYSAYFIPVQPAPEPSTCIFGPVAIGFFMKRKVKKKSAILIEGVSLDKDPAVYPILFLSSIVL